MARTTTRIPCNGSQQWTVSDTFGKTDCKAAGQGGYVMVSDNTCRLFGYHGLLNGKHAFSLDHMFGF